MGWQSFLLAYLGTSLRSDRYLSRLPSSRYYVGSSIAGTGTGADTAWYDNYPAKILLGPTLDLRSSPISCC
jgi:hypothetical protein